MERKRGREN